MNGAANAAVSGGLAGALVIVLCWMVSLCHVSIPPEVQSALSIIITALCGLLIHNRSGPAAASPSQPPPPQEPIA